MLRRTSALLATVLLIAGPCLAARLARPPREDRSHLLPGQGPSSLTSSGTGVRFKAHAGPDTFCLYGGPNNPTEGKFQDGGGAPGILGHAPHAIVEGEWFGLDLTEGPTLWQVSTFCAETLDGTAGPGHGLGNQAWWAGQRAQPELAWATPPGYGNHWNAKLQWRATMADPSVGQTVGLSFVFHHDLEPDHDFFEVEYDSSTTTRPLFSISGADAPFIAPGVRYPQDVSSEPILYAPFSYAGPNADEIILRLVVTADGAGSDEDGLWPTQCGAAIVDDLVVTYTDGVEPVIVDSSDVDTTNSWRAQVLPYRGDFSDLHANFSDIDPCRENQTPVAGFVDYGQCPKNGSNNGGEPPCFDTGGTVSLRWHYGILGGWVVNYSGGLTLHTGENDNEIWSPPIAWDLPGTADDDLDVAGAKLRFDVWKHLPLADGLFYHWRVRSSVDDGVNWSRFRDRNFVYYGETPRWQGHECIVSDLVQVDGQPPTHVQVALGMYDLSWFFWSTVHDATPAPMFDNVTVQKFRVDGPSIFLRKIDVFLDGFPQSGQADFTTLEGRQNADVRLDIRDVGSGHVNVPGDSMIVAVASTISGTELASVELEWVLDKNPWFDDARVMPVGTTIIGGGAAGGWDQWTSKRPGQPVMLAGAVVPNWYSFDLPDEDFLHPGDVLRFLVRATDTDGRVTTLPKDTSAFATGYGPNTTWYPRQFSVSALPSFVEGHAGAGTGRSPTVLLVNATDLEATDAALTHALRQSGLVRGRHYDVYESSRRDSGIGSSRAHGATPDQLAGYSSIVYLAGSQTRSLSDGSDRGGNDKSDDVGTLLGWFGQDDDRHIAHFGYHTVSALLQASPGPGGTYASTVLGVTLQDADVSDEIWDQSAPRVVPNPALDWTNTEFVAHGGCPGADTLDSIGAGAGAVRGHEFLNRQGVPFGGPAQSASVLFAQFDANLNTKIAITFPYGLTSIWDESEPELTGTSMRSVLLREILDGAFGVQLPYLPFPVGIETLGRAEPLRIQPNPANPTTTIRFGLARREQVDVSIYDVRGARVVTVHSGMLDAGRQELVWRSQDDRGVAVASGVYFVKLSTEEGAQTAKLMIVK